MTNEDINSISCCRIVESSMEDRLLDLKTMCQYYSTEESECDSSVMSTSSTYSNEEKQKSKKSKNKFLPKFIKSKEKVPSGSDIFNEKYDELTELLEQLRVKLVEIQQTSAKKVEAIVFRNDSSVQKADDVKREASELIREFHAKLTALSQLVAQNEFVAGNPSKKRLNKMLLTSIAEDFKELCEEFDDVQRQASDQYRRTVVHQLKVANPDLEIPEDQQPSELILSHLFSDNLTEEGLRLLNERHKQLRSVEQELIELHQIYIGIAELVEQQGEQLSNIDCYIDRTMASIDDANLSLRQVYKMKKKMRKKKVFIGTMIAGAFISLGAFLAGFIMKP